MINPLINFYLLSSYSFLKRVVFIVRTWNLKGWADTKAVKESARGWKWGKRATEKNIPKLKWSNKRKKLLVATKQDISISLCSFHMYCTFLQKPEKRIWLYSSLFLSSLETRVKPELVWGQSRTCGNQRLVLLQEADWCHQPQYKWYTNVSGC